MSAVGQPLSRAEGRNKVTGRVKYTADAAPTDAYHAALVNSTIASGRVRSLSTEKAERAPGVVGIFTAANMFRFKPLPTPWDHNRPHGQRYLPLQDDRIHYAGQPIALVVAETLDQAAYAGTLIEVDYEAERPIVWNEETAAKAYDPPQFLWPVNSSVGDSRAGLAAAPVKIEAVYSTPDRHHCQMEPHASVATWISADRLTVFETTQSVYGFRDLMAVAFGLPPENIEVVSKLIGGGFGGKAYVWPHTLLTAAAARALKHPVRLQLTRAQMFSMVGHQPATLQTIRLSATKDGKLVAIDHQSVGPTTMTDDYIEYAANASRFLWGARGGISTRHKIVRVNRNTPTALRAPHEAIGHVALECAMDELAYKTGVDPVELRLRNDTMTDPYTGRPFSTRAVRECLLQGAERFGWARRSPEPGSMRDANGWLIGQGVAAAVYTHWRWPGTARAVMQHDGTVRIESGMHDIGTGTYTVMAQVAADELGLPPERVMVVLGDTLLPSSHSAIGSATMANAGASVMLAARALRERLVELAISGRDAPFGGAGRNSISLANGQMSVAGQFGVVDLRELLLRNGLQEVSAIGDYNPEAEGPKAVFSFSAVFAEVRVDPQLGVVRLNRFVGAYDVGQVINPKTARSQAIGGIIWGTGQALLEQSEMDATRGRYISRNLSGYLIPSNADIPPLDVLFCGEPDAEASPIGAKGMGELTAVSVAPAIANAVFHATGKRIRDLPITIEKLL
jgi:xanthine dehydrogenase YagR molybdenum-binding subunit